MRIVFFLIALFFAPLHALAETSIAVVDVQALLTKSSAARSLEKQVSAQKEKFLEEVTAQEAVLREAEKKLTAERATLSKEAFTARAREFEEKLYNTRKATQNRKAALDAASGSAMDKLRGEIYEVVKDIAAARGYNLVITKQNVIIGEQSIDITDEVMKRLNAEITDIKLEVKTDKTKKESSKKEQPKKE